MTTPTAAGLSESQQAILDAFRTLFVGEATLAAARAAEPLGFDAELWHHVQAIGGCALGVSEANGGAGLGMAELVVMAEEIGRSIASVPLVEHTVAARLLDCLGVDGDALSRIVDGHEVASVALHPAVHAAVAGTSSTTWTLVPGGAVADVVIGVDGGDLVVVTCPAPGVARPNHACAPLAHRSTSDEGGGGRVVIGTAADLETAIVEWRLLTAASLVGIASTALDLGVAYVKDRHQFGVPIGSFQAVQHQLAELPGLIDGARLLVHEAAWALDGGAPDARVEVGDDQISDGAVLAEMAFLFAADTASTATARSLHVHGGYGFAEEYDIQLLYRRARGWALVAGDLPTAYQRLADRLVGVTP